MNTPVGELVTFIAEHGYKDYVTLDNDVYSVINTDNPMNPTVIYINFPLKWTSEDGRLDINYTETDLNR